MSRQIAISDIHGCLLTFKALLENKLELQLEDELYLLGDFIDRGPESKAVIDYVLFLKEHGYQVECLLGNHEQMLQNARGSIAQYSSWYKHGGKQTLLSFDLLSLHDGNIPDRYWQFFEASHYYLEVGRYLLVHAGLDFKLTEPLSEYGYRSMLWARNWYPTINKDWLGNRIVIHGHTPITTSHIESQLKQIETKQYLDIDAGCYAKNKAGFGHLCAFDMSNQKVIFQPNIDAMDWF